MEFSLSEIVRKIRGINPPFLTERQRALAKMGGTLTKDERQAAAKNAYQTGNFLPQRS